MNALLFASAAALSFLLAACNEQQPAAPEDRQAAEPAASSDASGSVYSAAGKVTAISGDQVTIAHGPVDGIGWPAMTMSFGAGSAGMTKGVNVGDQVSFAFKQDGSAYTLTTLAKDR